MLAFTGSKGAVLDLLNWTLFISENTSGKYNFETIHVKNMT